MLAITFSLGTDRGNSFGVHFFFLIIRIFDNWHAEFWIKVSKGSETTRLYLFMPANSQGFPQACGGSLSVFKNTFFISGIRMNVQNSKGKAVYRNIYRSCLPINVHSKCPKELSPRMTIQHCTQSITIGTFSTSSRKAPVHVLITPLAVNLSLMQWSENSNIFVRLLR